MSPRRVALVALSAVLLAACGSAGVAPQRNRFTYGPSPSVSAKMICRAEAVRDINHVLGVRTLARPVPTWHDHRYTCPYRYAHGTMVLSVKELPTMAGTLAYMRGLRRTMGVVVPLANVGRGGFSTTNGSAVTRKDNKVLVVDVAGLPALFGHPATTREEVALTVTDIILACWRGD